MEVISIIIPAYNEKDIIGITINSLKSLEGVGEIIVINDGSLDDTGEVAAKYGARVINLEKNQGKAGAVVEGASRAKYELVALIDADLGDSAREAGKLFGPLFSREADMVIASFSRESAGGGFGLVRKLSCLFIKTVTGREIKSPLSGQRALKKKILLEGATKTRGFGLEFGLTLQALKDGCRVKEIVTNMNHRHYGKNLEGFLHRGRQLKDILKTLFLVTIPSKKQVK